MDPELRFVAEVTGATDVRKGERLQSLWSGYGELYRVHADQGRVATAIVKSVRPPPSLRGSRSRSHLRKCRSYEVEGAFYDAFAPRCSDASRVPRLLGRRATWPDTLLVLEDLDAAGFSGRRRTASTQELDRCLAWLADFHATFLGVAPEGLWEEGTYWHLATRPDELAAIADPTLREAAPVLDARLSRSRFRTIVHGDAKEANFCFGPGAVAAVDFQYAGGGCGMRDVAYLLTGRWSEPLEVVEARGLDTYFGRLGEALRARGGDVDAGALEREWRALYPVAWADFQRFLAGWAPSHYESDAESQRRTRAILRSLA